MLGTLEDHHKTGWKSYVPILVNAYISTRHESTGYLPHFLKYRWHPLLSVDAFIGIRPEGASQDQNKYVADLRKRQDFAYRCATKEFRRQGRKRKVTYDHKDKYSCIIGS